ncbi:MAG: aminotransferase class I/II-fold pyridoxal phosphate-dependent enzyme [Thermoanaerobaculia bacterium]
MSRPAVAAMAAYTLELREAAIKLNQNENPFDVPDDFKQELFQRVAARPWNRYPDFESTPLREALARAYGLAPENILTGNGSNELLAAAIGTFVGPGTPVIIPRPTFTLYEKLVTVAGGIIVPVDIDPRSGVVPLPAATPDAVVIICSPNNPTGGVLPSLESLLETGATVLFDRAYGDFAFDSLPSLRDRLVTFSTFSKAWGLAGLRVGWLATTANTAREIRKVKLPYSLNIVSETAAILALERPELRDRFVALVASERDRMALAMREVASIEVFPSQANFIAFRARASRPIFDELCARGILIRDISSYPGLANCLRVSIGTPAENDAFLAALKEIA